MLLPQKKELLLAIKFAITNNFLVIAIAIKMYYGSNNYVILKVYHISLQQKNVYCNEKNCCNNIKVIAIVYTKCCNKIWDNRFMLQKISLQ